VRKWLLVALAVVLVAGVMVVALLVPSPPKTQFRVGYDRVRLGMTPDEVHAVMGRWVMAYYPGGIPEEEVYAGADDGDALISATNPSGGTEAAYVRYAGGRVTDKTWEGKGEPTWLESLRFRLGW
jgi:hypothetical protein